MKIVARRDFISQHYGNVSTGQVLDIDNAHAQHFIDHGLARHFGVAGPDGDRKPDAKPTVFRQPSREKTPGAASQADQASQPKTVKKSAPGGRKARATKSR